MQQNSTHSRPLKLHHHSLLNQWHKFTKSNQYHIFRRTRSLDVFKLRDIFSLEWVKGKGKTKGKSHSRLTVRGSECLGFHMCQWARHMKGGAHLLSLHRLNLPQLSDLKRVGYPFAAGRTERVFRSPDQRWFQSGDLPHCKQAP